MANQQQLNWSYFKPKYAGKPEEDAEGPLLWTNDWMDTYNFPDDQKVRRFCLTLMGEASLWYETIRQAQLDWPAMQEHFRQQYSKFGNTREQYFYIWRSFQFDEATDTIDSYIHEVKQVTDLLDYGEPQILELFKNTLPSRLYYLLYQVDNLNDVIETAKRILTKEKIDKQKTGQSSTTPFMKASQERSKKNEKGVSFGAIKTKETRDRHSNSIDKLTSLVNKLNIKLDKREAQYKPIVYQNRGRGCGQRQNNYRYRNRSYSRDRSQSYNRGRGNFQYIRNYRPNYRARSRSRNGCGYGNGYRRNDSRQNYRRDSYRQDRGNQRYRNRSPSQDCSRSRQRYRSNSRNNFRNRSYDRSQSRNIDRSSSRDEGQKSRTESRDRDRENRSTTRSRSSSHVNTNRDRLRCFRCSEYDHFVRECPNALTDEKSGSDSEDLDDSTWQMLSQDGASTLHDFDMEDLNM